MGSEATCRIRVGRATHQGRALLETNEIIFRGDGYRLKIPFSEITSVDTRGASLTVRSAANTATFELNERTAARWAEKIKHPPSLLDKLGVKVHHRVVATRVNDVAFLSDLKRRAPDVSRRLRRDADVIIYGIDTAAELPRLAEVRFYLKPDGMIWVVTPKGKGGIKDTDVMAAGRAAGLVDVKVAAFSATHTASKFVIPKAQR